MKPRMVVVFYLMVLFTMYLGYNLVEVQARQYDRYHTMAMNQHIGTTPQGALRGEIRDRNNQILAASLTMPSVAANPQKVQEAVQKGLSLEGTVQALSHVLGVSDHEMRELIMARGTFVWLARKVPEPVAEKIENLTIDGVKLDGVFILREPTGKRFYPKGHLAVHILGYTGIDDNGLDGIEAVYDPALKGKPGELEAEMDLDGRVIPDGWSRLTAARPGGNVVLTVDESIQYIAERELGAVLKRNHAKSATCIVMDVHTGDILALANKPDYATSDAHHVPGSLRRNRALCDVFEPGSIFKVITAAAALDSHKITMTESFFCGTTITVDGWTLHNADDGETSSNGSENIVGIITHSFNVGTTSVALKIGKRTLFDYMMRFGFSRQTGVCLPGEAEGLVQPFKDWANITLATTSFGQGVAVTPIQMVCAMQAIANKGVMMKPRLVKEIYTQDGKMIKKIPVAVKRRVIAADTADKMRFILRNVVEKGTGKKAEIPGFPTAGKTGTASIVEHGVYGNKYNTSFLGFAPLQDPRIVVLVKVEDPHDGPDGHWGGTVAAPVFNVVTREALWRLGVQSIPIKAAVKENDKKKE